MSNLLLATTVLVSEDEHLQSVILYVAPGYNLLEFLNDTSSEQVIGIKLLVDPAADATSSNLVAIALTRVPACSLDKNRFTMNLYSNMYRFLYIYIWGYMLYAVVQIVSSRSTIEHQLN